MLFFSNPVKYIQYELGKNGCAIFYTKISHGNLFSTCSLSGLFYTLLDKDKRWACCNLAGKWVTRGFSIQLNPELAGATKNYSIQEFKIADRK